MFTFNFEVHGGYLNLLLPEEQFTSLLSFFIFLFYKIIGNIFEWFSLLYFISQFPCYSFTTCLEILNCHFNVLCIQSSIILYCVYKCNIIYFNCTPPGDKIFPNSNTLGMCSNSGSDCLLLPVLFHKAQMSRHRAPTNFFGGIFCYTDLYR